MTYKKISSQNLEWNLISHISVVRQNFLSRKITKICTLIVCGGWYGGGIGLNLGEKEINHLKNISKTVWSQILVSWFSAVITNRASILKIKFICVKNMFIIFLQFNCDMLHTINLYTKLVNLKLNTFCFKTLCRK